MICNWYIYKVTLSQHSKNAMKHFNALKSFRNTTVLMLLIRQLWAGSVFLTSHSSAGCFWPGPGCRSICLIWAGRFWTVSPLRPHCTFTTMKTPAPRMKQTLINLPHQVYHMNSLVNGRQHQNTVWDEQRWDGSRHQTPNSTSLKGTVHTKLTCTLPQTCMSFFCWACEIFWRTKQVTAPITFSQLADCITNEGNQNQHKSFNTAH